MVMLNTNQYPQDELVPRWQRRPRRTMEHRFSDDEMFGLPTDTAMQMAPTLQPRPVIEHPTRTMSQPIPTLQPRPTDENADPVAPVLTDPYAEYGPATQPEQPIQQSGTLRARVPGNLPGEYDNLGEPEPVTPTRDERIAELQANPDERKTKWWERALMKGFEGVQHANEMVNATRDPRTGHSNMSGAAALSMIGGNAALGVAAPKQVARELNARELQGLQGEQARELKMRGEQANVQQTELENVALQGRPKAEARKAAQDAIEKDLSRLDHYKRGENVRLDQRLDDAGYEVTEFDKRKGETPIFTDWMGRKKHYNRETGQWEDTNLPENPAEVPNAEGLLPKDVAGRAERDANRDTQDEEQYNTKTTAANAKRNGALESIKQIDAQLEGIDAKIEASKHGTDADGKPVVYEPDPALTQQKNTLTNARRQALADKAEADTIINSTVKPERMRMGETMQNAITKRKLPEDKAAEAERIRQEILSEPNPTERKRLYDKFLSGMGRLK